MPAPTAPPPAEAGPGPRARPLSARFPGFSRIAAVSASLVSTTAVTSVLGLVYWTLAARQTSVVAVGIAGAAVSLMMLLGNVGMLGLGTLLIAEVPRIATGRRRLLVRTSLAASGAASAALGLVAALAVHVLPVGGLREVGSPFNTLDFAVGTGIMGLTMVLDQAVLAVGSGRIQLERNIVSSAAKVVALVVLTSLGHRSGMDIFLAWTIGNVVSLPVVAYRTRGGRAHEERRRLVDRRVLRGFARSAVGHHVLNLALQAPLQLLSLVVVIVLSAQSNGYFSTARSITGFVFVLPFSITIGLFAAARGDESEVVRRMRLTIPLSLAASAAAVIALFPLGSLVLRAFGSEYSTSGLTTLRVLVLAGLPFVVKDHFVALRRVQGRTGQAALAALAGAVFEVIAAVVGAHVGGLVGLCAFWVGALVLEALLLARPLRQAVLAVKARDIAAGRVDDARAHLSMPTAEDGSTLSAALTRSSDEVDGAAMHSSTAVWSTGGLQRRAPRWGAGPLVALMASGLMLIAWAVARSRAGDSAGLTQCLYWAGYLVVVLPAVVPIASPRTHSRDRLIVSLALPVLLQLSRDVIYPTRFMFHDELIHANGLRLIDITHHLFATNSLLPVTEYYPGLEIAANGVQQLTGLPARVGAAIVLLLARLLMAGCLIAIVRRLSGSLRVGCLASLVYTCNPQALSFNSQFSYQSLALPLALFAVYLFTARRREGPTWRAVAPPVVATAATVVTHHLTGLLLVGSFALWLLLEWARHRGEPSPDRRPLAAITILGAGSVALWAALPGNTLVSYLRSIVASSVTDVSALARGQASRRLFSNSSGAQNPLWERYVSVAAVLLIVVALVPALLHSRQWLRKRGSLAVLLVVVGGLYPIIPAGHVTVTTAEVTDRSAGFLFLGVGLVLALWFAGRRRVPVLVLVPVIGVLFVGGGVLGAGTTTSQLPGNYLVSADARSIDAQNLAAADWLAARVPEGSRVFADRVGGLLAAADGGQHTVTHIGDNVDASRILLAPTFTEADRQAVVQAQISYVIVDRRDATGLPNEQFYIESGEYGGDNRTEPVAADALDKLTQVPGVRRIYDNGALAIYDVRVLDGH